MPGSGELRLVAFDGPGGNGRVHVALSRCPGTPMCADGGCPDITPPDDGSAPDGASPDASTPADTSMPPPDTCTPAPPPPSAASSLSIVALDATSVSIPFLNAEAEGRSVDSYEIRYRIGTFMTEADFESGDPAPFVTPGDPGQPGVVDVANLKPGTGYVLGIRSVDHCAQHSTVAVVSFETTSQKFTQLSGCFIATAAYGSALEPQVASLRRARDRLRAASPLFATGADLYYRSGPAAAALVEKSALARGLARRVIAPFAGLAEALDAFEGRRGTAP